MKADKTNQIERKKKDNKNISDRQKEKKRDKTNQKEISLSARGQSH